MISVEAQGAAKFLNLLENVVKSGQTPTEEEIEKVFATESVSFMVRAYSRFPEFSKERFIAVVKNLANPEPTGKGLVLSKLEEGLRSCLNHEEIALLRQRIKKILKLDFAKAEETALKYLPPETSIKSTVYLTIDAVNTGMMFEGNASLSILTFDPDKSDIAWFSHELHHAGFEYWIKRNQKLQTFLKEETKTHEGIAVKLILNLLSEGLANYFCTPRNIHKLPKAQKHNEKIKKYEQNLNQMIREIRSLLSDCLSKTMPIESCEERLMKILTDPERILPPVHFIGGRIIEMFEQKPEIKRADIINLCKNPSQFFSFYSKIATEHRTPKFSEVLVQQMSMLLGES